MHVLLSIFLTLGGIPHHLTTAQADIENIYWEQLKPSDSETMGVLAEKIQSYQAEILMTYHTGDLSGEEAFQLYQGSLSYMAAGFRKIGWEDAARLTYENALPLVEGTDEEIFVLLNLADLYAASKRLGEPLALQEKALAIFEQVVELPQFLSSNRMVQQEQVGAFLQKAQLEIYRGDTKSGMASLQAFIDHSYQYEIPLQAKEDFMGAVRMLNRKAPLGKRGQELLQELSTLEKASQSFSEQSTYAKKAANKLKTNNFEWFTTLQK